MADPYLPLYTRDWRSDPRLRECSLEARGLWIEMMCLMHDAPRYGHLVVGEKAMTEGDLCSLARQVSAGEDEVQRGLADLKKNGVYSVADDGVIFSRRMVRDIIRKIRDRENGRLGGNPSLKPMDNQGDNPPDKPGDKANAGASNQTNPNQGNGKTSPSPSARGPRSARVRVERERENDEFGVLERDVLAVISIAAAGKTDGCLTEKQIDTHRQRLARARRLYGLDALRHGLNVAIDKGMPPQYAAGVAKNFRPSENVVPFLPRQSQRRNNYDNDAAYRETRRSEDVPV